MLLSISLYDLKFCDFAVWMDANIMHKMCIKYKKILNSLNWTILMNENYLIFLVNKYLLRTYNFIIHFRCNSAVLSPIKRKISVRNACDTIFRWPVIKTYYSEFCIRNTQTMWQFGHPIEIVHRIKKISNNHSHYLGDEKTLIMEVKKKESKYFWRVV